MARYTYIAKNRDGKEIRGMVEAASEQKAFSVVRQQGLEPRSIARVKGQAWWEQPLTFFERVTGRDLAIFSRQLAVMIGANLPIVQALAILTRQMQKATFARILADVTEEVDGGAKLSEALGRYENVFSLFYVNLIRSGETSGRLDEVLDYLADQQEKDYDLSSKIQGAMIYPAFILAGLFTMGTVMMIFVVPKLTGILSEANVELPWTTKLLIGVSGWLTHFWWLLLLLVIGGIVGIRLFITTESGRLIWDTLKLRVPVFGRLFQKIYLVRFSRGLMTLIGGGIPLVFALDITGDLVGNAVMRKLIHDARNNVRDGHPLAATFTDHPLMRGMAAQMIETGEQTGKLAEVLAKLAEFNNREIDNDVRSLVSLIEPLIMVVMGVAVGIMVIAIILPMYNLAGQI